MSQSPSLGILDPGGGRLGKNIRRKIDKVVAHKSRVARETEKNMKRGLVGKLGGPNGATGSEDRAGETGTKRELRCGGGKGQLVRKSVQSQSVSGTKTERLQKGHEPIRGGHRGEKIDAGTQGIARQVRNAFEEK